MENGKVLEFIPAKGGKLYRCECDCGMIKVIPASFLRGKYVGGCRKCKAQRQKRRSVVSLLAQIKVRSRRKGMVCDVTKQELLLLLEQQDFKCALSGLPIIIALGGEDQMRGKTTASVDRIDPSLGYVKGNIQWVHKDINRIKWVLNQDEFIQICKDVASQNS